MNKIPSRIRFRLLLILLLGIPFSGHALPLKSQILGPKNSPVGLAYIYIDYVELMQLDGTPKGLVSFVKTQSGFELFVMRRDEKNEWTGRASDRRLYDVEGKLLAFYDWTTFWSYVYAPDGTRLGQIKCLAFRGVCAAGAAAYLAEILEK